MLSVSEPVRAAANVDSSIAEMFETQDSISSNFPLLFQSVRIWPTSVLHSVSSCFGARFLNVFQQASFSSK